MSLVEAQQYVEQVRSGVVLSTRNLADFIEELARQLEQAETRIAVLEMGDMTATAHQWELAFKREKELLEQAEREKERYREALDEAGPLMEEAMSRSLWGSLQGTWRDRALAWHRKHNETLREVQALSEQHERSSDLGNSVARKNTKPSGEVGEEA